MSSFSAEEFFPFVFLEKGLKMIGDGYWQIRLLIANSLVWVRLLAFTLHRCQRMAEVTAWINC